MIPVVIPPDLWEGDVEGAVSAWLFAEGDTVRTGDLIAEVMVEKTSYDVTAPADGMLQIRIPAETPFKRGAIIAAIG
ncbi:MAG: biotin attachment protein [Rhodospirillaceae bacterium]|nr:biotin attachment protein [Rhodospirillaceae bacterium]